VRSGTPCDRGLLFAQQGQEGLAIGRELARSHDWNGQKLTGGARVASAMSIKVAPLNTI